MADQDLFILWLL